MAALPTAAALMLLTAACTHSKPAGANTTAAASGTVASFTAAQGAAEACRSVEVTVQLVEDNATAHAVLTSLSRARHAADSARQLDPRWLQLASAIELLDAAIRHDSPREIPLALALIRAQCVTANVAGGG